MIYCQPQTNQAAAPKQRGPTKVQPFNLSTGRKASDAEGAQGRNPYISLAELNMKYYCKTPDRYRTKPRNGNLFIPLLLYLMFHNIL